MENVRTTIPLISCGWGLCSLSIMYCWTIDAGVIHYCHVMSSVLCRLLLFHSCIGDTNTVVQLGPAVRFNGGGHINHSIFWTNLSPNGGGEPEGMWCRLVLGPGWGGMGMQWGKDLITVCVCVCSLQHCCLVTTIVPRRVQWLYAS